MSRPASGYEAGSPPVRVRVPAKVNLHLGVGPRRDDGFHELVTVFQAVDLYDEVTAEPADELSLTVTGADDVPTDARNLAWRAAELLARTAGIEARARLHIDKRIPVAGGMAGGSADAAAALVACTRLWDLDTDHAALLPLAAQLGSDVAFPLVGRTALGTGRGERLEPVECATTLHWVFATAEFGISAGDAYRELDRQRPAAPAPTTPDRLLSALADGDVEQVAAHLHNDLEPAALALAPQLRRTLDAADLVGGTLAAIVSGSGPTCAFLCTDRDAATLLAATLETLRVCSRAHVAHGPVAGASIRVRISG